MYGCLYICISIRLSHLVSNNPLITRLLTIPIPSLHNLHLPYRCKKPPFFFLLKTLVKVNRSFILLEPILQLCRRRRSPLREVGDRRGQEYAQGETDERELGEARSEFTTGTGECTLVGEEGHDHWGDDKYGTNFAVSTGREGKGVEWKG